MQNKITKDHIGDTLLHEILPQIDVLFGKIFDYNYKLMKKSEDLRNEGKYDFVEIFDFYITSQALGLLKNMCYFDWGSLGLLQNVRCILEGMAIKKMYQKGDINQDQLDLLQKQVFLIEYKYYSRFPDLLNTILEPEKLKKDYEDACAFYRSKLKSKYTEQQINNILNSNIPFLGNPKIKNHHELIRKYLGDEAVKVYGFCSQVIHPSDNCSY